MRADFAATFEERLAEGAQVFGIPDMLQYREKLVALASLVLDHNSRAGLTRVVDPAGMVGKHFLDSFKLLGSADWDAVKEAVDVGSGAGFQGLVLAVCREGIRFTLLEASAKKAEFLRLAAGELGVTADVVHVRAEDYGQLDAPGRERFDVGLARAAAKLAVSCEYVLPLVRPGGVYLAQLGPGDGAALERLAAGTDSERALRQGPPWQELGGTLEALIAYDLPWDQGRRFVGRFRKVGKTPARYPRRAGTPGRKPLPGFPAVKDGSPA